MYNASLEVLGGPCRQLGGGHDNELSAKVENILGRRMKVMEKVHNITREEGWP